MRKDSISDIVIEETSNQLLRALARRFNYHDAEDLAQQAICRLLQHPDVDNPGGWTWKDANYLGMRLRRAKKREAEHREALAKRSTSRETAFDPVCELIRRECEEIIEAGLATLNEFDRQLIDLENEFTYQELARFLNFSHQAIKARLARARKNLRTYVNSRLYTNENRRHEDL